MHYIILILIFLPVLLFLNWSRKLRDNHGNRSLERRMRLLECKVGLLLEKAGIQADIDPVKAVVDLANALRKAGKPEQARDLLRQNLLDEGEFQLAMRLQKEAYREADEAAAEKKRPHSEPKEEKEQPTVTEPKEEKEHPTVAEPKEEIIPPPVESAPPPDESLRIMAVPAKEEADATPTGEPQAEEKAPESSPAASGSRWQGNERDWQKAGRR